MRQVIVVVVVAVLLLGWGARPADASSKAQARWEGAAIALGTIGLIAVLSDAAQAQPLAFSAGVWYPGSGGARYCPPPPPAGRIWVPGHWVDVDVWVPAVVVASSGGGGCRDHHDRHDRHRGWGHRGRHDHDACGPGGHLMPESGGRFERRRVWKEGHYR